MLLLLLLLSVLFFLSVLVDCCLFAFLLIVCSRACRRCNQIMCVNGDVFNWFDLCVTDFNNRKLWGFAGSDGEVWFGSPEVSGRGGSVTERKPEECLVG